MDDNSKSTIMLVCTQCGLRYQAVVAAMSNKCICGSALKPVEPKKAEGAKP